MMPEDGAVRGLRAREALVALAIASAALVIGVVAASLFDAWVTGGIDLVFDAPAAEGARLPPGEFLAHALAAEAGLLLVAAALTAAGPAGLSLRLRRAHVAPVLLGGAGVLALNAAGSIWMEHAGEPYGGLPELSSPGYVAAILVVASIAAPLVEELLFRELLLTRVLAPLPRPVALALTSLAFGALHLPAGGIVLLVTVSGLGAIFGWLRIRCGSLAPSILVHALNNVAALALAWVAESAGRT